AFNKIENNVTAYIQAATVSSSGNLTVRAHSKATIRSAAIGGAGAFAFGAGTGGTAALAGAGAFTVNDILQKVTGSIRATSTVTTSGTGTLTVEAVDESKIVAAAGGIAISVATAGGTSTATSLSIGASVAFNTIRDKSFGVLALVEQSIMAA